MRTTLTFMIALLLSQSIRHAQITGRVVRLEAPASYSMGIYELGHTLAGREPDASSALYTAPIIVEKDSSIRARVFRPGVMTIPFITAGTEVTFISDARFL
jgi:hypothetical protein